MLTHILSINQVELRVVFSQNLCSNCSDIYKPVRKVGYLHFADIVIFNAVLLLPKLQAEFAAISLKIKMAKKNLSMRIG